MIDTAKSGARIATSRLLASGVAFTCSPGIEAETGDERSSFAEAEIAIVREGKYAEDRTIRIRLDEHTVFASTGGLEVTGRIDRAHFVGRATIAIDHPRPGEALTTTLAVAIAEQAGGLALHAAAIEVGGRAFVFVGPSGAGKSTACRLATDARELAADRVLLVPDDRVIRAYRLAGGEPTGLEPAADGPPVAAILRVNHDGVRATIEPASAPAALSILRAAALASGAIDEPALLDRLAGLASQTFVGTIYTRLDLPLDLVRIP